VEIVIDDATSCKFCKVKESLFYCIFLVFSFSRVWVLRPFLTVNALLSAEDIDTMQGRAGNRTRLFHDLTLP
jgi:hypothetical protein